MTVYVSPFGPKPQMLLSSGQPAVGGQLFFYAAGSSTKQNTYTNSTGLSANTNPIVLNALGEPSTEIWFTAGQLYKVVYAPAGDTDPPSSPIWTIDNLTGVTSAVNSASQWVSSGVTPTYTGTTAFTVPGDQTNAFQVGRRVKATVSAGTVYGTITNSVFGAVTTVTLLMDGASVLDSGLSSVDLSLLEATSYALPSVLRFSAGTLAAPGLRTAASSSTGWYSPVDNTIAGSVIGTEIIRLVQTDLELTVGRLKFPATQNPSTDPNTLDDYEEGTWTPTLTFATPGDLAVVYSTRVGVYTKIGRLVTATLDIATSTFTFTTASGALNITGLPFTSANTAGQTHHGACSLHGVTKATYTTFTAALAANSATVLLVGNGSGVSESSVAAADMPSAGSVILRATLTYNV